MFLPHFPLAHAWSQRRPNTLHKMADLIVSASSDSYESSRPSASSETGTKQECSSSGACVSLLTRLRSPKPSELARKRKIERNPPPKGKRKLHGRRMVGPKSVSPSQHAREHPREFLTVSNKQLFCRACCEELSLISRVSNNHIKSAKHKAGKERFGTKEKSELDIAEALKVSDEVTHLVGETFPQEQRITG